MYRDEYICVKFYFVVWHSFLNAEAQRRTVAEFYLSTDLRRLPQIELHFAEVLKNRRFLVLSREAKQVLPPLIK